MRSSYLDSHFSQRLRCEQSSNVCHDRSIQPTHHDPVSLSHDTVRQDHIDSRTETFDNLDFQDGTLELGEVHQPLAHTLLSQLDQQHDHIRHTFTGDGGSRDQGDVSTKVLVLVVQDGVETLFGEGKLCGGKTSIEFSLGTGALSVVRVSEATVGSSLPAVTSIDLVERYDERRLSLTEQADRFQSLRLETVLDMDSHQFVNAIVHHTLMVTYLR